MKLISNWEIEDAKCDAILFWIENNKGHTSPRELARFLNSDESKQLIDRFVANAQLDSCEKEAQEKVKEIFEEIEGVISWGGYEELADGSKVRDGHIMSEPLDRLKKKLGV